MKRTTKGAIAGSLSVTALAAALMGLSATSASALTYPECTSDEFVKVTAHQSNGSFDMCYANGGEGNLVESGSADPVHVYFWVDKIWTGNNHVQYLANGRWQPDQPIPPGVTYTWPNHPGGIEMAKIRIV